MYMSFSRSRATLLDGSREEHGDRVRSGELTGDEAELHMLTHFMGLSCIPGL